MKLDNTFTTAQWKALAWLPKDGSWRVVKPQDHIGKSINSLKLGFPWFDCLRMG